MSSTGQNTNKTVWQRFRSLFAGLLLLSGLILLSTRFGELENFVHLLHQVEPVWLLIALVLQLSTYVCVAAVWYLSLRYSGQHIYLWSLIPLGIAKLFSDQAIPSIGMSGTAFFVAALNRRGVANPLCMATLLLSLVAYYRAYLLAALATIMLLLSFHELHAWTIVLTVAFAFIAVGIPAAILWLKRLNSENLPRFLVRLRWANNLIEAINNAPWGMLHNRPLIITTTLLHLSVFILDAATLWVMLHVLGVQISFLAVFPSFMLASMVMTIGPIPLGLGTFEVACVSMLGAMKVPLETALAGTLLLRGLTLWLPMLPGMYLARRALR